MADTVVTAAAGKTRPTAGASRVLYNIFVRNLSSKIAAAPMIATVLIVFVGCTIWTV